LRSTDTGRASSEVAAQLAPDAAWAVRVNGSPGRGRGCLSLHQGSLVGRYQAMRITVMSSVIGSIHLIKPGGRVLLYSSCMDFPTMDLPSPSTINDRGTSRRAIPRAIYTRAEGTSHFLDAYSRGPSSVLVVTGSVPRGPPPPEFSGRPKDSGQRPGGSASVVHARPPYVLTNSHGRQAAARKDFKANLFPTGAQSFGGESSRRRPPETPDLAVLRIDR